MRKPVPHLGCRGGEAQPEKLGYFYVRPKRPPGSNPTGEARHPSGAGSVRHPRWSGLDTTGRAQEALLPDFAGMTAHRAGWGRHNRPLYRLETQR
jgi:hypothetical protein